MIVNHTYKQHFICLIIAILIPIPTLAKDTVIIPEAKVKSAQNKPSALYTSISTTQFNKKDLTLSPAVNLSQFFKQEQSVVRLTNASGDSSQTALSLRGFGDNAAANSLILIDGFPLTNPSLFAPNFNSILLSDIERIDILQGSKGALYGDQAVGGVVEITTRHPKRFFVSDIFSIGSDATLYESILVGDKKENGVFYKFFGLLSKTDHYRKHQQENNNNIAAQIGLDYARGTVSANIQSYANTIYFPGGLTQNEFDANPKQATEWRNYSRYRTTLLQLLNKHSFNDKWLLETRLSAQKTQGSGFIFLHFNRTESMQRFQPRFITHIQNNKLIVGYDGIFSYYRLANKNISSRVNANENDVYAELTSPINQQIDVITGVRKAWQTNRIEEIIGQQKHSLNQVFVTELGLVYRITNALSFFIRRDGNFSFPKANEQTWLPSQVKALQVQTGTSYESGIKWGNDTYQTQLSIYRLQLHNEIAFNPTQTIDQPFGAFNNLDDTLRYGISLAQRINLTTRASINGQVNYVHARLTSGRFAQKTIPGVPAWNGNFSFNYAFTSQWSTQYILLYNGSRFASDDLLNVSRRVPGYWLNDIAIQYKLRSFIFNVDVNNIWDKHYPNYVFYDAFAKENVYYPAAGRTYAFIFKVNLD